MKTRFLFVILGALVASSPAAAAGSVTVGGVQFSNTVTLSGTPLALRGAAVLRYLSFIKAYAGAFYLPEAVDAWDVTVDVPRRLELSYYRAIEAGDFDRATRKKVADNVDAETYARLEERLARLGAMYRDVRPGDRYALNYTPGRGTELALNGVPLGRIDGADFAAALFAVWLGPAPIDEGFKAALLGGA